jgi:hypothetical protein
VEDESPDEPGVTSRGLLSVGIDANTARSRCGSAKACQHRWTREITANRTIDGVVERLGGVVVGKEREKVDCAAAAHRKDAVDQDLRGVELRKGQRLVSNSESRARTSHALKKLATVLRNWSPSTCAGGVSN